MTSFVRTPADPRRDELLAAVEVLPGRLRPGPPGDAGFAARLRAELVQARQACDQGRLALDRHIVELVRSR